MYNGLQKGWGSPVEVVAVGGDQSEQVTLSCTTVWPRRLTLTAKQATLLAGVSQREHPV
jgi:hypothetical protein